MSDIDAALDDGLEPEAGPSKDDRVLAVLALMGGDRHEVNERDLFLICWHTFPNSMRWVDTVLPNPDTFTASLRRLDARGYIERIGKTDRDRRKRKKTSRRSAMLEGGRSGVVRARLRDGALEQAGITAQLLEEIRTQMPNVDPEADPMQVLLLCIDARQRARLHVDEAALMEVAFHRYPGVFAYSERPEFPDIGTVRSAIEAAQRAGLITLGLTLTESGRQRLAGGGAPLQLDTSAAFRAGVNKVADRIEEAAGYRWWKENGTLHLVKPDELFRMLRIPPTTDPAPIARTLRRRLTELLRVDRSSTAEYLMQLAQRYHPDVVALLSEDNHATLVGVEEEA